MDKNFKSTYTLPDFYNWPFFFTIQKHDETRKNQFDKWSDLLKDFCKTNKVYKISKDDFLRHLGKNEKINRQINSEFLDKLFDYFLKIRLLEAYGKDIYYVFWKKLEEWEETIYSAVIKQHRVETLETLDYLIYDEEMRKEEFYLMEKEMLELILKDMEKKLMCHLLTDDNGIYVAVKFIKT